MYIPHCKKLKLNTSRATHPSDSLPVVSYHQEWALGINQSSNNHRKTQIEIGNFELT